MSMFDVVKSERGKQFPLFEDESFAGSTAALYAKKLGIQSFRFIAKGI